MISILLKLLCTFLVSFIFMGTIGHCLIDGYKNNGIFEVLAALGFLGVGIFSFVFLLVSIWSLP